MSRTETVRLVEESFEGNHKDILNSDALRRDPEEQLFYLDIFFEELDDKIRSAIRSYGIEGNSSNYASKAKTYIEFIKLRLRLTCQLRASKVYEVVEKMVKNKTHKQTSNPGGLNESGGAFYPIEDCLQIVTEYN